MSGNDCVADDKSKPYIVDGVSRAYTRCRNPSQHPANLLRKRQIKYQSIIDHVIYGTALGFNYYPKGTHLDALPPDKLNKQIPRSSNTRYLLQQIHLSRPNTRVLYYWHVLAISHTYKLQVHNLQKYETKPKVAKRLIMFLWFIMTVTFIPNTYLLRTTEYYIFGKNTTGLRHLHFVRSSMSLHLTSCPSIVKSHPTPHYTHVWV